MLMVIFGAGASMDSAHTGATSGALTRYRPPLASELFDLTRNNFAEAIDRYHQIRPLIPGLTTAAKSSGTTIERELERLQGEDDLPLRPRQLAAVRYYLQHILWECGKQWLDGLHGITNYMILLHRLDEWALRARESLCIVTFNYDTMLDVACHDSLAINLDSPEAYVANPERLILKLHGSVNWAREIEPDPALPGGAGGGFYEHVIENAASLVISDRYTVLDDHGRMDIAPPHYFPAVAMPVETKAKFECPSPHVEAFNQAIRLTDRLLLVGWRATETYVLKLLAGQLTRSVRAHIVTESTEASQEVLHNLIAAGVPLAGPIVLV